MLMSWMSRLYGAGSGWHLLRGVCHHYRQQSFSGLHSPGRSNYTITWNKACSLAGTRRYECQVHGIHKYSKEISVVYSVCSACHHCIGLIRFLITGMWKCIGFESFHAVFGFDRIFCRFFGSWWFFSTVLRFLISPNAPLLFSLFSGALCISFFCCSSLDIRLFTYAFSCSLSLSSRHILPILASFLTFIRVFLDSLYTFYSLLSLVAPFLSFRPTLPKTLSPQT